ncbi:MAG: hypothetical protein M1832_004997 [Thelocarpon impressellum]|nr:MAG: hypothetical protein M1832_004997 [Thelocarpon impressellum]
MILRRGRQIGLSLPVALVIFVVASFESTLADANVDRPEWRRSVLDGQQQPLHLPPSASMHLPMHSGDGVEEKVVSQPAPSGAGLGHPPPLPTDILPALVDAHDVMQSCFFELWQGTWPDAIDWTAAVLGTQLSAALSTLSSAADYTVSATLSSEALATENVINRYFSHLTSYYFGQDAFRLRNEAHDDMLWVVLGWLESIRFIKLHSSRHYQGGLSGSSYAWYGTQFIPALAHRTRVFYDLAAKGWDTALCGGGMVWNPYLRPYKNAITNELYIAASVGMYLYFPGDNIASPFGAGPPEESATVPPAKAHDPKYLAAALEGYRWLSSSNMTNARGLFTDGYHVRQNGSGHNTKCDDRNEMVYTYNQGVLLSGLRGLWESTGARSFLEDGHALVAAAINGTGWTGLHGDDHEHSNGSWAGLGRDGVLEEYCDAGGNCSQDAQTFKGIFFHHLALFCAPLPAEPTSTATFAASVDARDWHSERCGLYGPWIAHNARAAYVTRDADGQFGMWWGHDSTQSGSGAVQPLPEGADDYRNDGVRDRNFRKRKAARDVNDRGRGRTVETQSGGAAVLRAYHEIVERGAR